MEFSDELVTEVSPAVDVVVRKVAKPLERILPQHDREIRCHGIFHHPDSLGGDGVDGKPTRVLFGLVLVDVGDLEV